MLKAGRYENEGHTSGVRKELSPGKTNWDLIVQACQTLSGTDLLMIPSFEITGSESKACRNHVFLGCQRPLCFGFTVKVKAEESGLLLETVRVLQGGVTMLDVNSMVATFETVFTGRVKVNCYYRVEVTAVNPASAASGRYPYAMHAAIPSLLKCSL